MAQKEIVWSKRAKEELQYVLEYYTEHNQSPDYAIKISQSLRNKILKLQQYPKMGRLTNNGYTRILV